MKASTGLRHAMLDTGSLKSSLDGGTVKLYAGPAPLTADDALNSQGANTLLCTITDDGGAGTLTMETAATGGGLPKLASQVWKGTNAASGTASFFRFVASGDDGLLSTTQVRLQGTIATAGADMNISDVNLTAAAEQAVDFFVVGLPTS